MVVRPGEMEWSQEAAQDNRTGSRYTEGWDTVGEQGILEVAVG
jgi:hypothetical protein